MDNFSQNIKRRLSFTDAVAVVFKKYAIFTGRSRRSEFWWFVLAYNLVLAIFNIAQWGLMAISYHGGYPLAFMDSPLYWGLVVFCGIFYIATFLPGLSVTVRRLHDIGKSGWNIIFAIIPIVGWIMLIVWLCQDSDAVANKYGESPKYMSSSYDSYTVHDERESSSLSIIVWILGIIIAILVILLFFTLSRNNYSAPDNRATDSFIEQPTELDSIVEVVDSVAEYVEPIEETASWEVVNNAYVQVLDELSKEVAECSYFLYDITGNGTPELWIKAGSCEADYMLYVCTYDKGVKKIFETGAGHSIFYDTQNGIVLMCAHMGYSSWYRISYNGQVNIAEIFSEDINGTDNGYSVPDGEFIELKSYQSE